MKKIILSITLVMALLCTMFMFPVSASEPTNLVPADVFQSLEKMQGTFAGSINSDAADFFVDSEGDYVHHVNTPSASWPYTTQALPSGDFTLKMEIQPIEYENSKTGGTAYGGAGILLGYGAGGGFPWMNIRLDFNFDLDSIEYYIWEHLGSTNGIVHEYGDFWYDGDYTDDLWVDVVFEFTATETKIYVDGIEVPTIDDEGLYSLPENSLGHYPTTNDIKYIGFFSEGSTGGFNVKNFGIYEGIGHDWGFDTPDETEPPVDDETQPPVDDETQPPVDDETQAPVDDETQPPVDGGDDGDNDSKPTDSNNPADGGDEEGSSTWIIILVVAIVVVAAAAVLAVVLLKKKKK